jgi:hypothetical protein
VVLEQKLCSLLDTLDVTATDRERIRSRRGRNDLLHRLLSHVIVNGFDRHLDDDPRLFAFDNGVFDMHAAQGGAFRPIVPEDLVSTPTGWSYDPDLAVQHRAELEAFLRRALPIEEDRKAVLDFHARLLHGTRTVDKFLVLTDDVGGGEGKDMLSKLFLAFFGNVGLAGCTQFLCGTSSTRDASMNAYKASRLLVANDLHPSNRLNTTILEPLTRGVDVVVGGVSATYRFIWRAGIVLLLEEGHTPQFDAEVPGLLQRMIHASVHAVRSVGDPHPRGVDYRFPLWLSALADVLHEAYFEL